MKADVDYYRVVEKEHKKWLGKTIRVASVMGYVGDDQVDIICDPPVLVKVLPTRIEDLHHDYDDWIDPYWDIEVLEERPELKGVRSTYVYGPSYDISTGIRDARELFFTDASVSRRRGRR